MHTHTERERNFKTFNNFNNFQSLISKLYSFLFFQKITSTVFLRQLSDASTDLRKILSEKIPKEQERVKAFRKTHGATKVGEVTVDMVCIL